MNFKLISRKENAISPHFEFLPNFSGRNWKKLFLPGGKNHGKNHVIFHFGRNWQTLFKFAAKFAVTYQDIPLTMASYASLILHSTSWGYCKWQHHWKNPDATVAHVVESEYSHSTLNGTVTYRQRFYVIWVIQDWNSKTPITSVTILHCDYTVNGQWQCSHCC